MSNHGLIKSNVHSELICANLSWAGLVFIFNSADIFKPKLTLTIRCKSYQESQLRGEEDQENLQKYREE